MYKKNNYIAKKYIKAKRIIKKKVFYEWLELDCVLPMDYYKNKGILNDKPSFSISHSNGKDDGFFPVNHFTNYQGYEFLKGNKLIAFYKKVKDSR